MMSMRHSMTNFMQIYGPVFATTLHIINCHLEFGR